MMLRRSQPLEGKTSDEESISSPRVHGSPRNYSKLVLVLTTVLCTVLLSCFVFSTYSVTNIQAHSLFRKASRPKPSAYISMQLKTTPDGVEESYQTKGGSRIRQLEADYKMSGKKWEGFVIPAHDRSVHAKSAESPLTYGEILYDSLDHLFLKLIDNSELTFNCSIPDDSGSYSCLVSDHAQDPRRVFYDIGSGAGKVVVQSFLSNFFQRSTGIEITRARYTRACDALELISKNEELCSTIEDGHEVSFVRQSFLEPGLLHDASHVFACSTCFSEELMKSVVDILDKIPRQLAYATLKGISTPILDGASAFWEEPVTINTPSSWSKSTTTSVYVKRRTATQDYSPEEWSSVLSGQEEYCSLKIHDGKPVFVWKQTPGIDYNEYRNLKG